ncbi:unnamed protein product [Cuscuta europaea]|uniref:Retrotransposon Copia-like N-terminal domain-containing protein n=1 Tax=Cuscuta europaea TaxID=41803 RepID=A0A9P0YUM3_CUSEU|nr:unnamed protein product [Cuscuta europaea]
MTDDQQHQKERRRKINDVSSPYYLSNSDFPGINISGLVLKGEGNYREWSTAMKNAFRAKRKMGFIDGTIERPEEDIEDLEDWLTVNSMLVGWLMTAVDPTLRTNLTYMESANDLWEDLKTRFAVGDAMRVYELKESIRECQQNGQPITAYFGRLKALWDDYDGYRYIPQCVCQGCTCDLNKKFLKHAEKEKTHDFLLGLDSEAFGVLRSNILSLDDLPPFSRVYQMVTQEERHRNMVKGREEKPEAVAFAVRMASNNAGREEKIKCTYCNKVGHEVENCFKKSGRYPEWWFDNPGRGRGGRGGRTGSGRGRGRPVAHAVQIGEPRDEGQSKVDEKQGVTYAPGFTSEQWKSLLKLGGNCKSSSVEEKLSGPTFEDADWSG